jgi:SAM-dependent methyltransferase
MDRVNSFTSVSGEFLLSGDSATMKIGILGYKLLNRLDPKFWDGFRNKVAECSFTDPQLAAKFFPYQAQSRSFILPMSAPRTDIGADLPVPPEELWYGYARTPDEYLAHGQGRVDQVREILETTGFKLNPGQRILDFGCGSGIMLRWFTDIAQTGEAWGADIFGPATVWCEHHLSPPFKFVTNTSFPHLPFEDCYFDFIYADSVFTHIADLAEAWLLELKRIVRPGGRLLISVHDNETIKCVLDENMGSRYFYDLLTAFDKETRFRSVGFSMFAINRTPGPGDIGQAQVVYDREYLRRHWGNYLKIITTVPRIYGWYNTAFVLEK